MANNWIGNMFRKILLIALVSTLLSYADELTTRNKSLRGAIISFEKFKIQFQAWEAEKAENYDPNKVTSLVLDEPVAAQIFLLGNTKKPVEAKLIKFENAKFFYEENGMLNSVSFHKVIRIDIPVDVDKFMKRRNNALNPESKNVSVVELLEYGKATVIHFHFDSNEDSAKQGEFVKGLCDTSEGKAVYKKITVNDKNDPIVKKYKLATFPQFWFFSPKKAVSSRLTENITEEDIQKAFNTAIGK